MRGIWRGIVAGAIVFVIGALAPPAHSQQDAKVAPAGKTATR
jgi:hypothetical protein